MEKEGTILSNPGSVENILLSREDLGTKVYLALARNGFCVDNSPSQGIPAGALAEASAEDLLKLSEIGVKAVQKIREVLEQKSGLR